MKKTFFAVAAIAALVACNKQAPDAGIRPAVPETSDAATLTAKIVSPFNTKATVADEESEAKVNTIDVFVFRTVSGSVSVVDGYKRIEAYQDVVVPCTKGSRKIYAIVNSDKDLSGVSTEAELCAIVSELKNNHSAGALTNFVMMGTKDVEITSETTQDIAVDRLAARVWVKKITKNFSAAGLQDAHFEIVRMYLTNVVNQINLGRDFVPDATEAYWYNMMQYDETAGKVDEKYKFILRTTSCAGEVPGDRDAPGSVDLAVENAMYAYPNPTQSDALEGSTGMYKGPEGGPWSIRPTRLVIEATLDGQLYYYPITLPSLEYNKSYEISNLVITRPGSDDPDMPVVGFDVPFHITVNDWTQVLMGTDGTVTI